MSSRGFSSIALIVIILIGIIAGIYLVRERTNFLPKADFDGKNPGFKMTRYLTNPEKAEETVINVLPEDTFTVNVLVETGPNPVKLIQSKIRFPQSLVEVVSIDATSLGAIPVTWKDQTFNNQTGLITLNGEVSGEGFKNDTNNINLLARVNFKVRSLTAGKVDKIEFLEQSTKLSPTLSESNAISNVIKQSIDVRVGLSGQPNN